MFVPWLAAMGVLIVGSGFFSASEAALFYLSRSDRRRMRKESTAGVIADALIADADRLLSAVLFWNLVINIGYFALASKLSIDWSRQGGTSSGALAFSLGSLVVLIVFSEMLPKSLSVLAARRVAVMVAYPLAAAVRVLDPVMPVLRTVQLLSRRLMAPRFGPEAGLEIGDLERAIDFSRADARLAEHEQMALANLVMLSEIRADEWMRPRSLFRSFRPPVQWSDLGGELPPSEYLLVTEHDGEAVIGAIDLKSLFDVRVEHLEHLAQPVVAVPWCTTVADVMDELVVRERRVAAIVNEYGETIGIVTLDDILDAIFLEVDSSEEPLWSRTFVRRQSDGVWHVSGLTSLRHLAREFDVTVPPMKSVTVTGCIWEKLQRIAHVGDEVDCGRFHFRVLEAPAHGLLLVELTLRSEGESP